MQANDETELIARSLNADHSAYAQLVERYKNAVYHHSFAIVRNEDVAEDIAQEAFIAAYYKLSLYNPAYRLSTWLFKIATNKALDYLRRSAKTIIASDELIATIASHQLQPDVTSLHTELHEAVEKLDSHHRAVISSTIGKASATKKSR